MEPLEITAVAGHAVRLGHRNQLLVKVEAGGLHGWGEAGLSSREFAVLGALDHYRQRLLGQDAMRIGRIWQDLYRGQYFEGGNALVAAIAAIDIALHDLVGKHLGVPVYQLLGGKQRDRVPCFASTFGKTQEQLVEEVHTLRREGWTSIRALPILPPGREPTPTGLESHSHAEYLPFESIDPTAKALVAIREACGTDFELGIDYHHRLTVAEAAQFCQRLPAGTLDYLEEPIRTESPEAYAQLRRLTPTPLAIGEELAGKWSFAPFLEAGLMDFCRVDICNVGGLTESLKVAAMAEARYIDLMPHNPLGAISTAAAVHLAAAVPNFASLECREASTEEFRFMADDVIPVRPRLDGVCYPVPDGPGLGVEVNEAALADHPYQPWECPTFHRPDGSYTNW
ncbi:MAG: mandelate racemase/muconate lactonizing enzyme family protein [Planctomycetota bacterium]